MAAVIVTTNTPEHFMSLALHEAKKALGRTSPNPCVGAVIVREGKVVGTGYHRQAGSAHAEVNALHAAGELSRGATLYVTLEPCNHMGRTPPCTQAILRAGIGRVVIGLLDPNPRVVGGGAAYLRSKGVEVESGILEQECRALVRPFLKHSRTGLPWVVMKAAMSLDGKISQQQGSGGPITGPESRLRVHALRNELDAILIGADTACIDNPSLTTRLPEQQGRDPLRIVLDTHLRLSPAAKLLCQPSNAATWIFCGPDASATKEQKLRATGALIQRVALTAEGLLDLSAVLVLLGQHNVCSVLVEGGGRVHNSLLKSGHVDQVHLFIAPFFIGNQGTSLLQGPGPLSHQQLPVGLSEVEVTKLGGDILVSGLIIK